jgi:hypothetical protein
MKQEYFYKKSKVKGQTYLQIWLRTEGKETYIMNVGSAEKCYKLLKDKETNNKPEITTNLQAENKTQND